MFDKTPLETLFAVPQRNGLTKPERIRGKGVKMLNMGELFSERRISNLSMDRVPCSEKELLANRLENGDLLFARQSLTFEGAGQCSIFLKDEEDVVFESHLIRCRFDKSKADPLYYFYFFESKYGKQRIGSIVEQVAAAGIRGSDLIKLPVFVPSLSDQKTIAQILSTLDDKIEVNKKMNKKLEEIAKNLFKSWFIDFDPVKAKAAGKPLGLPKEINDLFPNSFEDSKIGKIPKNWKIGKIEEIAKKISDRYKKEDNWSEEKLIDLSRMPSNSISLNSFGKGKELSTSICRFKKYDFLFGSIRPYFYKSGICPFDGVSNTSVFILRGINMFDREFLYFYSSNDITFKKSIQYSNGTKMPIISWKDFKEFCFALPNEELRKYFSKITKPIVEKIIYNIEEQEILEKMRDKILPKLISGELEISNVNKIIQSTVL
jgi:type I restriction enzyme, S subunit